MQGHFSKESLSKCNSFLPESLEFTRCVRPDGSAYGTEGKCRKGSEQPLFESDGGIHTGASGGVIGGNLFGAATPTKVKSTSTSPPQVLRDGVKQVIKDSEKLGFSRNKRKVDSLLEQARLLLEREKKKREEQKAFRAVSPADFSDLHEPLIRALVKVRSHGDRERSVSAHSLLKEIKDTGLFRGKGRVPSLLHDV